MEAASNPQKDDFQVTESTIVCSKHFSPDNYIIFSSKKRALKDDAVPTSNPQKDDFQVTESTIVCSKHFSPDNYIIFSSKKRALKDDAVPTNFLQTKTKRRQAPKRLYKTSETETASETEQF